METNPPLDRKLKPGDRVLCYGSTQNMRDFLPTRWRRLIPKEKNGKSAIVDSTIVDGAFATESPLPGDVEPQESGVKPQTARASGDADVTEADGSADKPAADSSPASSVSGGALVGSLVGATATTRL